MNIEHVILEYLRKHPGASAKKILTFFDLFDSQFIEKNTLQAAVCKKLRTLKKERKVHNNGNSW